ncbi:hypothetical protein [Pseudomonas sp. 460]|nr:hypothetical protein [Pseudomonas sp. 460]TCV51395.1 hypothetical protein EDB99_10761 [Pseudomonas sp. 460]
MNLGEFAGWFFHWPLALILTLALAAVFATARTKPKRKSDGDQKP